MSGPPLAGFLFVGLVTQYIVVDNSNAVAAKESNTCYTITNCASMQLCFDASR